MNEMFDLKKKRIKKTIYSYKSYIYKNCGFHRNIYFYLNELFYKKYYFN